MKARFTMLPTLEYIRQTRRRLGVTQRKLADLSGVSTSMINQIESGRCKPSYETARRIFEKLTSLEQKHSLKAIDICSRRLIYVQNNESLHTAIVKMRSNFISQVPVFEGSRVVGLISEDGLARNMIEKEEKQLSNMQVSLMMDPPPPIVDEGMPAKALIPLVRYAKCILVSEKGAVTGVITLSDTLKMVE
ncbi:MAG: putative transcriptional regulator, family [Nitrososphaeraceae archaeon]|nr:putative transcriptional regulator, family [Nitrososphaeraceae archaeon]